MNGTRCGNTSINKSGDDEDEEAYTPQCIYHLSNLKAAKIFSYHIKYEYNHLY